MTQPVTGPWCCQDCRVITLEEEHPGECPWCGSRSLIALSERDRYTPGWDLPPARPTLSGSYDPPEPRWV